MVDEETTEWPSPELELMAWRDFMDFAIGHPEIRAAFMAETGMRFAATRIDLLIDDATGYSEDTIRRFVVWATESHWGPMPELVADKWHLMGFDPGRVFGPIPEDGETK